VPKLFNVSKLNNIFDIDGNDWIEIEEDIEVCSSFSPPNDFGGEDCFWNVATPEMIAKRNSKISETYNSMSEDAWRQLISHRLSRSKQAQSITLDAITFQSKNQAARYAMKTYGVSRNTAIRYIDEGRDFNNKKQKNYNYGGNYTGCKYD